MRTTRKCEINEIGKMLRVVCWRGKLHETPPRGKLIKTVMNHTQQQPTTSSASFIQKLNQKSPNIIVQLRKSENDAVIRQIID